MQEAVAAIALRADDGSEIALRVSAGASVFPEDGETYERLLARADRRMYRNKAESKAALPTQLETEGQAGITDVPVAGRLMLMAGASS